MPFRLQKRIKAHHATGSIARIQDQRGESVASVPKGEVILLSGQKGPVYYLVPVQGDLAIGDKELRRAMAMASLQESWRYAEQQGFDGVSDDEVDEEIRKARQRKSNRKNSR